MSKPDPEREHGIEHEPHLRPGGHEADPGEEPAGRRLARERAKIDPDYEVSRHSVFDEPAIRAAETDSIDPAARPGYAAWLSLRRDAMTPGRSWLIVLLVMLGGGPWAILGALWGSGSAGGILGIVFWGPFVEEIMKVAILVTLLELRPYLLTSRAQIHIAAAGSALGFAAIENLIYFHVYMDDPTDDYILWRWTVCVILHVGCSIIASLGVARVWKESHARLEPPALAPMLRYLVAAVVVHSLYNATVTFVAISGLEF